MTKLDREKLSRLWQADPAEFRKVTRQIIEDFITSVPEESRKSLRELQVIIDAEVSLADSPLEACRKISGMMLDMYKKPGGLKDRFLETEALKAQLQADLIGMRIRKALPKGENNQAD